VGYSLNNQSTKENQGTVPERGLSLTTRKSSKRYISRRLTQMTPIESKSFKRYSRKEEKMWFQRRVAEAQREKRSKSKTGTLG